MAYPVKIAVLVVWLAILATCMGFFFTTPDAFTAQNMAVFLQKFNHYVLVVYILISMMRGFTLLPSTPFVLVGSILFPALDVLVIATSMAGILLSSTIIYYFSRFMGFDAFFERKFPKKIEYLQKQINRPQGMAFVVLWSCFPLVPTDLMCYVAGTVKMSFPRFIFAVFLGELPIVIAYVLAGSGLFELLF